VRETLLSMMKAGNIPQVMLFAGPKGTGKTSASRILGALLNDAANEALVDFLYFKKARPKKLEFAEPDIKTDFARKVYQGASFIVQEMDAASHRGIDDVRALKERVQLPPQTGKMSVYILDEAHMLTTEAFNALLKLLEEPPPHTMFILATTEFHKVPATIVSRATTVNFRKALKDEIYQALEQILKAEKIKFEKEALELIAERADGSFRDAVKLLELACQSEKLTKEEVENIIGVSLLSNVEKLLQAVLRKDEQAVCQMIEELRAANFDQKFFYKSLFDFLHVNLMKAVGVAAGKAVIGKEVTSFLLKELLAANLELPSPIPFLPLEIKLLEIIFRSKRKSGGNSGGEDSAKKTKSTKTKAETKKSKTVSAKSTGSKKAQEIVEKVAPMESETKIENLAFEETTDKDVLSVENIIPQNNEEIVITDLNAEEGSNHGNSKMLFSKWDEFVKQVASKNLTLAALLRSAKPVEGINGLAKIGVFYRFHQEQLSNPKFLTLIEECGELIVGKRVKFEFVLQDAPPKADLVQVKKEDKFSQMAEEVLM